MAGEALLYERIGSGYRRTRRPDPRIAARFRAAIGDASSVVDIGAGAGSYEPRELALVVAVDPSLTMLAQRPSERGDAICGLAESLPIRDGSFDVAMASLTMHHWSDLDAGIAEMQRIARRQVVFLFDEAHYRDLWLLDYYPEMLDLPNERTAPSAADVAARLGGRIETVPVPADCRDGFGGAFWARPEAYLDPIVQAGISSFAQLPAAARRTGDQRLRDDLASGAWDARHGHLRALDELDVGYRLVVADRATTRSTMP